MHDPCRCTDYVVSTTTMAIRSSRIPSNITMLRGVLTLPNAAGQDESFALPAGFGDCMLYTVELFAGIIATEVASLELQGVLGGIYDPNSAIFQEPVLDQPWVKQTSGLRVSTMTELNYPATWYATEVFRVLFDEIDSNASPTAVLAVLAKVRRLRA